jgi:hypothetical protein
LNRRLSVRCLDDEHLCCFGLRRLNTRKLYQEHRREILIARIIAAAGISPA